jgi:rSAM/selenodomain-associated transferase 2
MATGEELSVVIPSWREGMRLLGAIRAARVALGECEFVVVAYEESADTRDFARAEGVTWVDAPRANRGLQLRLGAERARGRHLVFLHADSRLPIDASRLIRDALEGEGVAGGAFRLRFDWSHPVLDLLAWMSGMTVRTSFLGDQCLFCTRSAYDSAGGFCPQPLFEDVDLARRLARVGKLVRLRQAVTTSARRFMNHGPLRQLATNAVLLFAFWPCPGSPDTLLS